MLLRIVSVATVCVVAVTACTTVRPITTPLAQFVRIKRPSRIWITRHDGTRLVLAGPSMEGDTLMGWEGESHRDLVISDIARLEAPRPAPGKTAGAIVAGVGFGAGLLYILSALREVVDRAPP